MDKAERETHDFMNVESFSQLPFIRPAPVKEKGIRLFGIEFGGGGGGNDTAVITDESEYSGENTTACEEAKGSGGGCNDSNGGESSSRKFECHYCCRNFPTSQALGGHQNAHKRERQHAKRAHLQSAMVHGGGAFSDAQLYGFMNYGGRLGSAPNPATTYHHHHSWNPNTSSNNNPPRFYGSSNNIHASYSHHHHHHHQSPINGNPLALWRIPAVQSSPNLINHDRSIHHPLPLLANDELKPSQPLIGAAGSSQSRYVYEAAKSSVQDHVSLDLHL